MYTSHPMQQKSPQECFHLDSWDHHSCLYLPSHHMLLGKTHPAPRKNQYLLKIVGANLRRNWYYENQWSHPLKQKLISWLISTVICILSISNKLVAYKQSKTSTQWTPVIQNLFMDSQNPTFKNLSSTVLHFKSW